MSISAQKRKRIIAEFELKLPQFLKSVDGVNGKLRSIAYEIFMDSLITKKPSSKMYGMYVQEPAPSNYTAVYFQECVLLMFRFPDINEKLGLSLNDLLKMSPATITMLEEQMVAMNSRKKSIKQNAIKDTDYGAELVRHQRKKNRWK